MTGRQAFGLFFPLFFAAGCASTSSREARPPEMYHGDDVWAGGGAHYDVTVQIRQELIARQWRCGVRVVEIEASSGLHRDAWQHVRAYDYKCDEQFDHMTFRYPSDKERANDSTELSRLEQELWFVFANVVPIVRQVP